MGVRIYANLARTWTMLNICVVVGLRSFRFLYVLIFVSPFEFAGSFVLFLRDYVYGSSVSYNPLLLLEVY